MFIAFRHSCIHPQHGTHSRSQALRSGRVLLSRPSSLQGLSDFRYGRHQRTYTLRFRSLIIRLGSGENRTGLRSYISLRSQHATTITPGPRQVLVPITSLSALAFAQTVKAPRVDRTRRLCPNIRLSQQYQPDIAFRGCSVHLMLRPADSVGATGWVLPPALQQFRATVSGQAPPQCYHCNAPSTYSAKREIAEPDSFHSGR